jgi:hypothetical protein
MEVETRENRESMCGDCQVEHECEVRHFIKHLGGAVVDVLFQLWLLDLRKRVLMERDREKMSTDADLQRTETGAW